MSLRSANDDVAGLDGYAIDRVGHAGRPVVREDLTASTPNLRWNYRMNDDEAVLPDASMLVTSECHGSGVGWVPAGTPPVHCTMP